MIRVFSGFIGHDVVHRGVALVLLGDLRLRERDRPVDGRGRVGEGERGVRRTGPPVLVDEVAVGRGVLERLVAVADAARHEHRDGRVHLDGERPCRTSALAHVDPRAEDPAGEDRDELVPRLGVDAAGRAARGVEGDVVLHRAEVGQAERGHLLALPVLLEPAARVLAHVEPQHDQARDRRDLEARGRSPSLPLRGVRRLGALLVRAPPVLVGLVPLDGVGQPGLEVLERRLPAELLAQLARLDGVAAVVAGAVGDVVEVVLGPAEVLEDQLDDLEVVLLAVGADQVGLADLALVEDRPDRAGVVVGVDPVADVEPVAVQLRADRRRSRW